MKYQFIGEPMIGLFAHYEVGYMMPVQAPSKGLFGFWEEFEAQYEAGGFFYVNYSPFFNWSFSTLETG